MAAGVGAVVVEAVDVEAAEEMVVAADDVPFVAVGSLVPGADWFVGTREPVEGAEFGSDLEAARALVAGTVEEVVHVPVSAIRRRVRSPVSRPDDVSTGSGPELL